MKVLSKITAEWERRKLTVFVVMYVVVCVASHAQTNELPGSISIFVPVSLTSKIILVFGL